MDGLCDMTHLAEDKCGVYLLCWNEIVVYVGKSTHLPSRLRTHRQQKKIKFNRILARFCLMREMNGIEFTLINKYQPKHNVRDMEYAPLIEVLDLAALGLRPRGIRLGQRITKS